MEVRLALHKCSHRAVPTLKHKQTMLCNRQCQYSEYPYHPLGERKHNSHFLRIIPTSYHNTNSAFKILSFLHVWVGEDIISTFNSVTETKSVPKHLFPLVSFNICGQSPTQITPPLPIYTIGAWISFSTGPKMHQDVKQFIKPSTWICERELRSIFKMMGISSLAQNWQFQINPFILFYTRIKHRQHRSSNT